MHWANMITTMSMSCIEVLEVSFYQSVSASFVLKPLCRQGFNAISFSALKNTLGQFIMCTCHDNE